MAIRGVAAQALAAGLGLAALGPPAWGTPAVELYYQRALISAANGDCRLFDPDLAAALSASMAQARGAALRSGQSAAGLDVVAQRAAAAAGVAGCASPAIAATADQVRQAFAGYAGLQSMEFPGDFAGWTAERPSADGDAHWRVVQRDRFGWNEALFGLVGRGQGRWLMAVASFADGARPYGARLVMRDASLTSGPYLDYREADIAGRIPIGARLPPAPQTRVFAAEAMSPAGRDLAPPGAADAWAFRFPAAALQALAGLDPREAVAVEFLFPGEDGADKVRTAYVEVGDFDAARAFQEVAQR